VMVGLLFAFSAIPYAMKDDEEQASETPKEKGEKNKDQSSTSEDKSEVTKTPAAAMGLDKTESDEPPEPEINLDGLD
jgi:hypothetical protein